jgi:hypothetical protein
MAKTTSSLLKNAFGSATQKGPKKGEGSGDTQHGELANSETPKKVSKTKGASGAQKQAPGSPSGDFDLSRNGAEGSEKNSAAKPRRVMDHSTKKILPKDNFSLSRNGAKLPAEAPMEKVMRHAHEAKVSATRSWIEGHIDSKEHDARHRRANAVLRHGGKRP